MSWELSPLDSHTLSVSRMPENKDVPKVVIGVYVTPKGLEEVSVLVCDV